MEEQPGLSDQYRKSSPWPLFIAIGLPIFEVGIVFPLMPLSVGGLLLFVGSVVGLLRESGHVTDPWRALAAAGVASLLVGALIVAGTGGTVESRGVAIAIGGGVTLLGGLVGKLR